MEDLFKSCDSRSVDLEAFRDLCNRLNISNPDADLIFEDLDVDSDGRISFADFSKGFSNFLASHPAPAESLPEELAKNNVWCTLTDQAEKTGNKTSDEGKLGWLLGELRASEHRHLVPVLEGAVEDLLASLRHLQEDKARLEDSWQREKCEHQKHLKRMEDEMDSQVKEVEMRLRMQAQEEVEEERKSLQTKMDTELHKLAAIEKVFSWFRTQEREPRLDDLRSKLNEAVYENHQLRMSLLDTQTSIALMRSEVVQLRSLYEEKCRELSTEKDKILEVLHEQEHLSRQLNLLHDANRRLLDSHDALKSTVECSARQGAPGLSRAKSGSIIGDYLDLHLSRFPEREEEEPLPLQSADRHPGLRSLNQSDSGVSTVRDGDLEETEGEAPPQDRRLQVRSGREVEPCPRRTISDIKKQLGIEDKPASWRRSVKPTPLPRHSLVSKDRPPTEESSWEVSGPPEQTWKAIFVGDAGVGKSSFALRLSRGVFVSHLSSTLGVDFLTRNLRVDGRNVAVQLWDTAGQERFRSLTQSYFRKADGVMLLYDCTCEQSFLGVRQWLQDIDKASFRRMPLMIVANKIDLREVALRSGQTCISTEQGQRLAQDCDCTFMEASAKDGSNVLPALAHLVRSMSAQQELQLSASTMQLCESKAKKGGCCGR